ncbi:Uncharacterized membrane protein YccC [Pseudoxanthomonas sp. GM95]|uniref:FUSC family protein n=1 Tax=Pseudoxanthomonas sp. GM95 TaxID=1881043 RepID=UPI0008C88720|nr:FUSC family protein [Pseudoxanthomonas sp. GM95]SEM21488.1 Uncharacterized membrane protein YccC [Pseudoxanthomonas sp. GM95]
MNVLLDKRAWLFSSKAYLAAVAALFIGLWGNLPRPYWAMSTVYIVIQPMLGGTRSRGIYRIVGTVIGAAGVVAILPPLSQAPVLLSLALSLWLAACLCLSLLNRGPSAYVFLLASYTTAFIGFPAVTQPEGIFDVAIARSEEIIVGALCAVLVAALVFPSSMKSVITGRIGAWMDDAVSWCALVLRRDGHRDVRRGRLAADLGQFEQLIVMASRDSTRHPQVHAQMRELRARMFELIPTLAGISDRLDTLHGHHALSEALTTLMDDINAWLREPTPSPDTLASLRARIAALRPALTPDIIALVGNSLLVRLDELLTLWDDCRRLQHDIATGHEPRQPVFGPAPAPRFDTGIEQRHVDVPMILFGALSAGATVFVYCLLWIWTGWPAGGLGAMMAAVGTAFFAGMDDPVPNILKFLSGTVAACVLAGIYIFGIFPAVKDFGALVLVLAPLFLPLGLLVYRPATMLVGLIMLANMSTLLGLQSSYHADFQTYINTAVSMLLGLVFAIVMTRLFRSVGAEWSARRLVRSGWSLLADAAAGHGQQDRARFTGRMLDLLGLATPRLAATAEGSDLATVDLLEETRIGLNILQLRRARRELPEPSASNVDALLARIAAHYRAQADAGHLIDAPESLRDALDASLSRLGGLPAGATRDAALLGLVGLRHGLFHRGTPENQVLAVAAS